jgi:hypothetical protein
LATVTNPGGLLTGVAPGFNVSSLTPGGPPVSIVIAPKPVLPATTINLALNQTQLYTVTLLDAQGRPTLPATGGALSVVIDNSNTAVIVSSVFNNQLLRQEVVLRGNQVSATTVRGFYIVNGALILLDASPLNVTP